MEKVASKTCLTPSVSHHDKITRRDNNIFGGFYLFSEMKNDFTGKRTRKSIALPSSGGDLFRLNLMFID